MVKTFVKYGKVGMVSLIVWWAFTANAWAQSYWSGNINLTNGQVINENITLVSNNVIVNVASRNLQLPRPQEVQWNPPLQQNKP